MFVSISDTDLLNKMSNFATISSVSKFFVMVSMNFIIVFFRKLTFDCIEDCVQYCGNHLGNECSNECV